MVNLAGGKQWQEEFGTLQEFDTIDEKYSAGEWHVSDMDDGWWELTLLESDMSEGAARAR